MRSLHAVRVWLDALNMEDDSCLSWLYPKSAAVSFTAVSISIITGRTCLLDRVSLQAG